MYGVADIERAIEVTVQKVSEDPSVDANALFKTQVQNLLGLDEYRNAVRLRSTP